MKRIFITVFMSVLAPQVAVCQELPKPGRRVVLESLPQNTVSVAAGGVNAAGAGGIEALVAGSVATTLLKKNVVTLAPLDHARAVVLEDFEFEEVHIPSVRGDGRLRLPPVRELDGAEVADDSVSASGAVARVKVLGRSHTLHGVIKSEEGSFRTEEEVLEGWEVREGISIPSGFVGATPLDASSVSVRTDVSPAKFTLPSRGSACAVQPMAKITLPVRTKLPSLTVKEDHPAWGSLYEAAAGVMIVGMSPRGACPFVAPKEDFVHVRVPYGNIRDVDAVMSAYVNSYKTLKDKGGRFATFMPFEDVEITRSRGELSRRLSLRVPAPQYSQFESVLKASLK